MEQRTSTPKTPASKTPASKKWQTFLIGVGIVAMVLIIGRIAFLRLADGADDTTLDSGERIEGRLEPGQAQEAADEMSEPPEGAPATTGGEP